MSSSPVARNLRRFAADVVAGLAVFVFLVCVSAPNRSAAAPHFADLVSLSASAGEATGDLARAPTTTAASVAAVALPDIRAGGMSLFRQPNHRDGLIVLAAVFSAMVAFNLAFFRHLRQVSAAAPRSRPMAW